MAILNYTTKIAPEKTVMEINAMLAKAGASKIMSDYDDTGNIVSLSFQLKLNDNFIAFILPTDWRPVAEVMKKQGVASSRYAAKDSVEAQARRTAWRITKDWVAAQLAIIEVKMVTTAQVFLPYAITNDGRSMWQYIGDNSKLLLDSGESGEK